MKEGDIQRRVKILVVNYDPANADLLVRQLALCGYKPTLCREPKEALALLARSANSWSVIIWNVTGVQWGCLPTLRLMNELFQKTSPGPKPKVLCYCRVYRGPQFRVDVERLGARLIYE